jgi:hypothetical protein
MSSHAETDQLNRHVDRWVRRYRVQRAVRWALRGAALALALALAITLIAIWRGLLLQSEFLAVAIGLTLIGLIGAVAAGFVWPAYADRLAAARRFDRDFGLRERISTALELAQVDRSPGEIGQLQLQDAVASARHVNVRQQLPLRIKRVDALFTAVLLIAVIIVVWRGESFFQLAAQTRMVQQTIAQEVAKVEELRQQIAADRMLTEEQRREMLEALKATQQQLKEAQSLEQATAVLTQGEKQFESLMNTKAEAQAEALRQAGRKLSQAEGSALQAFGQNLTEGDFLAAAENLRNLDVSQLSAQEREQLADQLENMAESVQANNPALAQQLREAAEAARNGNVQQAQRALDQAAQAMSQTAQQVARSNVARKVTAQMGQGRQRMIAAGQSAQGQTAQGNPSGAAGQSGQGNQPGQGNQAGQGAGQNGSSSQNGSAGSGSGSGRGTGTSDNANGSEAGSNPIDQNNGPGDGGETTYEPIYAPQRLGGSGGDNVTLPGSGSPNGEVMGQSGVTPGTNNPSQVPYTQVFAEYANAYRQAIDSGQVPLQLRDLIRQYFSSLEP